MKRYVQSAVVSCSVLAGALFLATSLSAQAPTGGAPAGERASYFAAQAPSAHLHLRVQGQTALRPR